MKNNNIDLLLINTTTAMNMLDISRSTLAAILGVSNDSVSRWFNDRQMPSELNIYKLNWFVYLVLDLGVDTFDLFSFYDLASLTLDTHPEGGLTHLEPWNGDEFESLIKKNRYKSDEDYVSFPSLDAPVINVKRSHTTFKDDEYVPFKKLTLNELITSCSTEELLLKEDDILDLFDETFNLNYQNYSMTAKTVKNLKLACDIYLNANKSIFKSAFLSITKQIYSEVVDLSSFVKFMDEFRSLEDVFAALDFNELIYAEYLTEESFLPTNDKEISKTFFFKNVVIFEYMDGEILELKNDSISIKKAGFSLIDDKITCEFLISHKNKSYTYTVSFSW